MGKLAEGLYADTSYLAGEDQDAKDVFCFLERIHPEFKAFTLIVAGRQIALDAFRYEMHRGFQGLAVIKDVAFVNERLH